MDADVAVIGLGTIGSMTCWNLSKKGVSVLGFEQFGIGHDRSAHGGGSRRFVVASSSMNHTAFSKESHQLYRELEEDTGQQLLSSGGTLTIGDPNTDRMKNVIKCVEAYNIPHEILDKDETKRRFPMHDLFDGEIAVFDKLGGVLRPEQIVVTAVNRSRQLGAKVYTYTKVTGIEPDANGVTIHTDNEQTFRVGKVIISAGPWANEVYPDIKNIFEVHRIIMTWFVPKDTAQFTEDKFPNFSRVSGDRHIIGTPIIDGRLVRVSGAHAMKVLNNANEFDKNVDVQDILEVRESLKHLMPGINPDPVSTIPFMDGYTTDQLPLVGATKKSKNILLMCGFSGSGFSQGSAMANIAGKLAAGEKVSHSIDHLSPKRFDL
ncbi:Sarcosine oxidase [Lentibacillus sp. JNUCC-1]|uniref:FAD-dependent oxidoreductase n=1 Tax=Lentibacillus sp. JNUCC-1 TaxID=2654513 RepID=UPI0012E78F02|nr:Sarcosine oxidase [Lentibacillus sp. JNUCC-1]